MKVAGRHNKKQSGRRKTGSDRVLGARPDDIVLATLLIVAVIFGGASRLNPIAQLFLCTLSGLIVAYVLVFRENLLRNNNQRFLAVVYALCWTWVGLQLLHVPVDLWSQFPGRASLSDAYGLLGLGPPQLPVSLSPWQTLGSLFWLLPPVAVFLMVIQVSRSSLTNLIPLLFLTLAIGSIMLGFSQMLSGRDSPLYFHMVTNWGAPVGFFANANHQASFLVACYAWVAIATPLRIGQRRANSEDMWRDLTKIALLLMILTCLIYVASGAGYLLGGMVVLIALAAQFRNDRMASLCVTLSLLAAIAGLLFVSFSGDRFDTFLISSFSGGAGSREIVFERSLEAVRTYMPFGTGLGSFAEVYRQFETPPFISQNFVNHAHNDYIEMMLELGIPGGSFDHGFHDVGILANVSGLDMKAIPFVHLQRAASTVVMIFLIHSLVDYPLRAPANACVFALAVAIMARRHDEVKEKVVKVEKQTHRSEAL